jgi:hypothetical protein
MSSTCHVKTDKVESKLPLFVEWVRLARYCALTGDTANAVHHRRAKGQWLDGVHCRVVNHVLWINLPAIGAWVENGGAPPAIPAGRRRN